jgi:heme/copper-type cytochrome/quinol oxidase subunit 2
MTKLTNFNNKFTLILITIFTIIYTITMPLLTGVIENSQPIDWGMYFQDPYSQIAFLIIELHGFLFVFLIFILTVVTYVLFIIIVDRTPFSYKYLTHHTLLEVVWTATPTLILAIIGVPSLDLLYLSDLAAIEVPYEGATIKVIGNQWYWTYNYNMDPAYILKDYAAKLPEQKEQTILNTMINTSVEEAINNIENYNNKQTLKEMKVNGIINSDPMWSSQIPFEVENTKNSINIINKLYDENRRNTIEYLGFVTGVILAPSDDLSNSLTTEICKNKLDNVINEIEPIFKNNETEVLDIFLQSHSSMFNKINKEVPVINIIDSISHYLINEFYTKDNLTSYSRDRGEDIKYIIDYLNKGQIIIDLPNLSNNDKAKVIEILNENLYENLNKDKDDKRVLTVNRTFIKTLNVNFIDNLIFNLRIITKNIVNSYKNLFFPFNELSEENVSLIKKGILTTLNNEYDIITNNYQNIKFPEEFKKELNPLTGEIEKVKNHYPILINEVPVLNYDNIMYLITDKIIHMDLSKLINNGPGPVLFEDKKYKNLLPLIKSLRTLSEQGASYQYDSYLIPSSDIQAELEEAVSEESNTINPQDQTNKPLRLLDVDNRLAIPVLTPIKLLLTSADVIHDFAVPSLGIKIDCNPGRLNAITVKASRPGTVFGQCSELCGVGHSEMPIAINILTPSDWDNFILYLLISCAYGDEDLGEELKDKLDEISTSNPGKSVNIDQILNDIIN